MQKRGHTHVSYIQSKCYLQYCEYFPSSCVLGHPASVPISHQPNTPNSLNQEFI